MKRQGAVRTLRRLLKPYGLRVEEGTHRRIVNAHGKAVYWFASSPSCQYFAENTLADLVKKGLVPADLKRCKVR